MPRPARRERGKPGAARAPQTDGGEDGSGRLAKIEIACWGVVFAAAIGALLWSHRAQFFLSWTDEQIHFYVARRMAQGAVLYRDIESARPPLVLFPLAWLARLGCSPLVAGRALVLGTELATAGLLLWGGWRLASPRAAALAALLFLTSPEIHARIHYTGIHLVALSATACVLFSLRGRPLWAGLFFGLTLAADQHGLVVCGVVAVLTVARGRRDALLFAAGALLVSAIVFGGVWAIGGRHLWQSLVAVHLHHLRVGAGVGAPFWAQLTPWLGEHVYLLVGAGLAAGLLARSPPASRDVRVLLLVLGAHVAVVLALAEAAFLYAVVTFPVLALLAGMGFDAAIASWYPRSSRRLLAGALAAVALTAGGWAAASSRRQGLDGRRYSFWPYLLHAQVSRSQQLDAALQGITGSMLRGDGTIFGDPTIVSALALRSGLRVSGELADLNPNWLEAGTIGTADVVARIEADGVGAVISPPFGLVQNPHFKAYLFACYKKPEAFFPPERGPGEGLPFFLVFTHNDRTTRCQLPPASPGYLKKQ